MKKMPKPEQKKMLKALNQAADYTKEGMSPDEALIKVAQEHELTAPKIERLCEAYNKANAVAYMKSAPQDQRADNYPIAKIANVIENVFGVQDKVAEEISFKKRNYAAEGFIVPEKEMPKVASERKGSGISFTSLAASMEICQGLMEKVAARNNRERLMAEKDVKDTLNELTGRIQRIPVTVSGKRELNKIAQIIVDAFGEQEGHMLINATNANIDDPTRYMPCLKKKACAVVMPNTPIYNKVKDLLEKRAHMLKMQKRAADGMTSGMEDIITKNPMASVLNSLPTLEKAPKSPHLDVSTGMTGEWDAYAKDLKSRRMLYDMMLNDEEISSYSPREIQSTYNDIVETFPELSTKRQVLKAILRKSLAQGGNMDIYELKDLISTGKESLGRDKTVADVRDKISDALSRQITNSNDNIVQSVSFPIGSIKGD